MPLSPLSVLSPVPSPQSLRRSLFLLAACVGLTPAYAQSPSVALLPSPSLSTLASPLALVGDDVRMTGAYADAFALYGDQRYDAAARAFASARAIDPSAGLAAEATLFEAVSLLGAGQSAQAVRLLTSFEAEHPTHPQAARARLAAARYFSDAGNFALADQTLDALTRRLDAPTAEARETLAEALYRQADAAREQGQEDRALDLYRLSADRFPDAQTAPSALYAQAFHQVRLGRLQDAANTFEVLGARYPQTTYGQALGLAFAEVYYELEDWQRLTQTVEPRLSSLDGAARERTLFLLAEGYNRQQRYDEAIVHYRTLLADYAGGGYYARSLYGLGRALLESGQPGDAARFLGLGAQEAQSDSVGSRAAYLYAVALAESGQTTDAAGAYGRVADTWPLQPDAPRARYEQGVLAYAQGRFEDASTAFDRLTRDYADTAFTDDALDLWANARLALGDSDGAERLFDRIGRRQQGAAPDVRDNLAFQRAYLLYSTGAYAPAARSFTDLVERAQSRDLRGDALFWLGETRFQMEDYAGALSAIDAYARDFPQGDFLFAAEYVRGWIHFRERRYGPAATAFERFIDEYDPERDENPLADRYADEAHLRLGDSYFAQRNYLEAANAYARVRTLSKDYALFQIGQAQNLGGRPERGRRSLERLAQEFPQSPWRDEAAFLVGFYFFQEGLYNDAVTAYRNVIRAYPNDPIAAKAQYAIGDAYYNAGDLEAAEVAYRLVLTKYPSSPFAAEAASSLQSTLIGLGRDDEAAAAIGAFIDNAPPSVAAQVRFRQAEGFYQRGERRQAANAFEAILRSGVSPAERGDALFYLGDLYADEGQTDDGARALRAVLDLPEHKRAPDAARRLGRLYLDAGRPSDALWAYRQLAERAPSDVDAQTDALVGQGQAFLALGDARSAATAFGQVRDRDDASVFATEAADLGLARVELMSENPDAGRERLRELASNPPSEATAEARFRLAEALIADEQPQAALDALGSYEDDLAGFNEWVAASLVVEARAFRSLGRTQRAIDAYDRVIQLYSDTPWAAVARTERDAL